MTDDPVATVLEEYYGDELDERERKALRGDPIVRRQAQRLYNTERVLASRVNEILADRVVADAAAGEPAPELRD